LQENKIVLETRQFQIKKFDVVFSYAQVLAKHVLQVMQGRCLLDSPTFIGLRGWHRFTGRRRKQH
jgi:hypothetical protein